MTTDHQRQTGSAGLFISALTLLAIWEIVERSLLWKQPLVEEIWRRTGGIVTDLFLADAVRVVVLVVLVLLVVGRIAPAAIGLEKEKLPRGVIIVAAVWGLVQIAVATSSLLRTGMVALHGGWADQGLRPVAEFLTSLGGEAFFQEVFWRGYVLAFLVERFGRRWSDPSLGAALAIILSQTLYAAFEIPGQIDAGMPVERLPVTLILLTLTGTYFALLYLRTENLWVAIGVHALSLTALPLFHPAGDASRVVILVAAILLIPTRKRAAKTGGGRSEATERNKDGTPPVVQDP